MNRELSTNYMYIETNKFDEGLLPDPFIYEDIIFVEDLNAIHATLDEQGNSTNKKMVGGCFLL